MKHLFKLVLLLQFCMYCRQGNSSDSAYILIQWNGPVDKPYEGFVFHRKDIRYDPENFVFRNYFNLTCELSDSAFAALKEILFTYENPRIINDSDRLFMAYYIGYFEGEQWIQTRHLNCEADFEDVYKKLIAFFKGTRYEKDIYRRWRSLGYRIGLPFLDKEGPRSEGYRRNPRSKNLTNQQ